MNRHAFFLALLSALALPAWGQTSFPEAGQPWPEASPESRGMSSEALGAARDLMRTSYGAPFADVQAIVLRDGHDVWHYGEPYALPRGLGEQKDWASCGRSLMTAMFGMAMREDGHDTAFLERPVRGSYNSFTARAMDEQILNKHLLSYTACADPPGSGWQYACHYFTMYKILRDVDGEAPRNRLARLADLIGADWRPYAYWGHGQDVPFLTIRATPAEAARWGYLWLNKGHWDGTQVVDSAFVEATVRPVESPLGGYAHANEGYQIHLNANGMWGEVIPRDAYAALGAGGHVIFVVPSLRLIVAANTDPPPYEKEMVGGEEVRDIRGLFEPIVQAMAE